MIKLYREENRLHASMINLQGEYAIFERKIVENTRGVMNSLQEYKMQNQYFTDHTVKTIMDTFNNLDADCEYKVFSERRQGELVPANASYRNLNDIQYENQKYPLVIPCKVGFLERKTFVTKNWAEHKYALTPSGYLHEYKSEKDFPCNPEKSIFIPHTTVVGKEDNMHHDYVFEIRGRNNSKGKLMKTFDHDKNYILRTRTGEDMQAWMDLLTPMSHQFRPSVPHEPEPYMQPINSTNVEVMSRSNTWASSPVDERGDGASQASTWASIPEDQLHNEDPYAFDRSGSGEATAGISNMDINGQQDHFVPQNAEANNMVGQDVANRQPQTHQLDLMDHNEKTQADEHNPFVQYQQETNGMTQSSAELRAENGGKEDITQGKLPISLFDQDETPQTGVQRNDTMPGSLVL
jgi:PH domain